VTLLFALGASDNSRTLLQFAIATGCWTYCIYQVGAVCRGRTEVLLAAGGTAALALTGGVSSWDAMILSESLSLSMVALYLGGILSLSRGGRHGAPAAWLAASAAAFMLALLRPVLVPLIFTPSLVPCSAWWRERRRTGAARRRRALVSVGAVLVAVAAATYAWGYNVRSDQEWGHWMGVPGQNGRTIQQYFVTVHFAAVGPELNAALNRRGAPDCLASSDDSGDSTIAFLDKAAKGCRQGLDWLSNNYVTELSHALVTDPALAVHYFLPVLREQAQQRADGAPSLPTPVPGVVTDMFFTDRPSFPDPLVNWSTVAAGLVAFRAWCRRRAGDGTGLATVSPQVASLRTTVGATLVAAYAGILGTAILSPTDTDRVGLSVTILLRLVLLLVTVRSLASILSGRAFKTSASKLRGKPDTIFVL
jgi:hypothetical protein